MQSRRTDKRDAITPEQREALERTRRENRRREPREYGARLAAEFVGTIIVTLGTIAPAAIDRGLGLHLGYAVLTACTGIATTIVIYALGHISGAHTNPCMTLAFALRGDFGWRRVPAYVAAQFLGATAAAALVLAILHPPATALLPEMRLGAWPAFWLEIVLTIVVVIVALATANDARLIGPESAVANGATTIFDRWIGGHISSGSMNPARTLGPALVVGGFANWWVFASAPLIGMALGVALVWILCGGPNVDEERKSGGLSPR